MLSLAFMPDEEIGSGTASFDLYRFQEDCAYTVDGWEEGEIEEETFNAVQATARLHGALNCCSRQQLH